MDYRRSAGEGKITPLRGEDQAHLRPRVWGASPPVGEYAGPYPQESLLLDVPTSLVNLDIVLPHHEFRKCCGLPELPQGRRPKQREYTMDGARGLVDLDWSQRTPIFHPDDIDRDPRFNQYPYPDDDLDYDDEEEMETDYQNAPPGGAGDTRVATPASAGCRCYRPPATYSMQTSQGQTSGSPRSTHTDTDMAIEMGGLSMAPGGLDTRCVPPRAKALTTLGSLSTPELAATVASRVTAATTQILEWYAGLRMRPNAHQWIRRLMLPSEIAYKGAWRPSPGPLWTASLSLKEFRSSTSSGTGCRTLRKRMSGLPILRWHLGRWSMGISQEEIRIPHLDLQARRDGANPVLEMRRVPRRDGRIVIAVRVRYRSELIGQIRVLVNPSPNPNQNIHLSRLTHPGWMNHSPGWSRPSPSLSSHLKPRRRTLVRSSKTQKRKCCRISRTVG